MDNFWRQAGIGNILPITQQQHMSLYQQMATIQQQYQQSQICVHPNCPICLERLKNAEKEYKKQKDLEAKKELDYKNRCKKYMEKWRNYGQ